MSNPIPFYAAPIPTSGEMPPGAIPVHVYGLDESGGMPPIETQDLLFLAAYGGEAGWATAQGPMLNFVEGMGYGLPGQVLATNSTGDGLEWVTPSSSEPGDQ